jgi:hypothetical protein
MLTVLRSVVHCPTCAWFTNSGAWLLSNIPTVCRTSPWPQVECCQCCCLCDAVTCLYNNFAKWPTPHTSHCFMVAYHKVRHPQSPLPHLPRGPKSSAANAAACATVSHVLSCTLAGIPTPHIERPQTPRNITQAPPPWPHHPPPRGPITHTHTVPPPPWPPSHLPGAPGQVLPVLLPVQCCWPHWCSGTVWQQQQQQSASGPQGSPGATLSLHTPAGSTAHMRTTLCGDTLSGCWLGGTLESSLCWAGTTCRCIARQQPPHAI